MLKKSTWFKLRWWMACCAILLNALAPSISHALGAARGMTPAADICSADSRYGDNEAAWHLLADCDYCLQHAGSDLFTPPEPALPAILDGHGREAAPWLHAWVPLPERALRCARGPPSRSSFAFSF